MGDALCGPSNPLQSFQKHTSADRTLHQDRLGPRQSPSQGFRSQGGSEALDLELAAFESNVPGLPHNELLQLPGPSVAAIRQLPIANHLESPSWATDFQSLNISEPQNIVAQRHAATPLNSQRGWQSEFEDQHRRTVVQNPLTYGHSFRQTQAPIYPSHLASVNTFQLPHPGLSADQAPAEAFDESAFEAAFEQARADMEADMAETSEPQSDQAEPIEGMLPTETLRIGSDNIPRVDDGKFRPQLNDADELARTAGQLLDSVQHDQSQKFKDSSFLALMRRIRDREVHVEGDEFREVSTSSSYSESREA